MALGPLTEWLIMGASTLQALHVIALLIFTASQLDLGVILEFNLYVCSGRFGIVRLDILSTNLFAELLLLLLILTPALKLDLVSHLVPPGDKARLEEHFRQE